MDTVDDVPIFAALEEERRTRTGPFARFALEPAAVEILSAGPAAGDLAGPGTSVEEIPTEEQPAAVAEQPETEPLEEQQPRRASSRPRSQR